MVPCKLATFGYNNYLLTVHKIYIQLSMLFLTKLSDGLDCRMQQLEQKRIVVLKSISQNDASSTRNVKELHIDNYDERN